MKEKKADHQKILDKLPDNIRKKAVSIAKGLIEQSIDENIAYGIGIYYAIKKFKIPAKEQCSLEVKNNQ